MYEIDKTKARKILIEELGFSPALADRYLSKLPPLHDALGAAVDQWLSDRSIAPISVEGLSIERVMALKHTNFLSAVWSLDVLLNEEMPAEERRRYREALERPLIIE